MVVLLSFELHYWFWNRPDLILIAVVSLGVLIFERAKPIVCLVCLGLLAGIAMNLKLFGAFYLLPLAFVCVFRVRSWRALAGTGIISGGLFVAALILPFGFGFASLPSYIANISLMRHQGFDLAASLDSLFYGTLILSLPLLTAWARRITPEDRVMTISLIVCTVSIAIIAGKPGGGPPYMMPLIPLALYLAARLCNSHDVTKPDETRRRRLVLCAAMVCVAPLWAYSWFQIAKQLPTIDTENAKISELREVFATFPDAEMGHNSGFDSSKDEFYRVERAFLGQVTRFDYVNYGDQHYAGLGASVLYPLFERCSVPNWILPRQGGRFLGTDLGGQLLLDDGALDRFHTNYKLAKQYNFYEVWRCKDYSETVLKDR